MAVHDRPILNSLPGIQTIPGGHPGGSPATKCMPVINAAKVAQIDILRHEDMASILQRKMVFGNETFGVSSQ